MSGLVDAAASRQSALRALVSMLVVALFLAHDWGVHAQSARSGVRVEYTAIEAQGGLSGRAFLPISSRDVALLDGGDALRGDCSRALRVRATARQTRGAVREVALTLAVREAGTLSLDATRCPGAQVETRLADGTVLSGGRGEVRVTAFSPPDVGAGAISGTFTQTTIRDGVPVTVRGEFRVPLAPRAPGAARVTQP